MRDLRNHGGDVLARVERGESLIVTRDGTEIAELRPIPRRSVSTAQLISRRRNLPQVDPMSMRRDIDSVLDASL
ncbi:type II toxin-antitoxin system prevent-host-death family antitoxin [Rhodococcus sp. SBT000017]|nr:type II toxin-antitoxin system prevent-host-death family antitoxin [Rhodococcus sp. SBT000017]